MGSYFSLAINASAIEFPGRIDRPPGMSLQLVDALQGTLQRKRKYLPSDAGKLQGTTWAILGGKGNQTLVEAHYEEVSSLEELDKRSLKRNTNYSSLVITTH